ncbi:MAG: hypothetical protein ACXABY_18335 [Candidatus Thorarchaeota archaeon]|jgi:hypothetical protein
MAETHQHPHPPTRLIASPPEDMTLPEREVYTPMGKSKFRSKELEERGYRYSFAKNCDDKLVEIVYLKPDGTTGTIIADIDSLFETKVVSKDDEVICLVTFKLLKDIDNPVTLHRAEVPINSINGGIVGKMLRGLLEYFLDRVYGKADSKREEAQSTETV